MLGAKTAEASSASTHRPDKMRRFLLLLLLPCILDARPPSGYYTNPEVDELRIEMDDLKHALNTTQVELNLLDERLKKQNNTLSSVKGQTNPTSAQSQLDKLEKKVTQLEKTLEKATTDLRTLNTSINQTLSKIQTLETDLVSHDKRLEEVTKLKGTLTSISKAIGGQATTLPASTKVYKVKAGDSLEKVARNHKTTADILRKLNQLQNDRILVGQELRLPDE